MHSRYIFAGHWPSTQISNEERSALIAVAALSSAAAAAAEPAAPTVAAASEPTAAAAAIVAAAARRGGNRVGAVARPVTRLQCRIEVNGKPIGNESASGPLVGCMHWSRAVRRLSDPRADFQWS